jgi:hypothetical protein
VVADHLRDVPASVESIACEAAAINILADRREFDHCLADANDISIEPGSYGHGLVRSVS